MSSPWLYGGARQAMGGVLAAVVWWNIQGKGRRLTASRTDQSTVKQTTTNTCANDQ